MHPFWFKSWAVWDSLALLWAQALTGLSALSGLSGLAVGSQNLAAFICLCCLLLLGASPSIVTKGLKKVATDFSLQGCVAIALHKGETNGKPKGCGANRCQWV